MKISWEIYCCLATPRSSSRGLAVHLSIIGEQDKVQFAREVLEDIGIYLKQLKRSPVVRVYKRLDAQECLKEVEVAVKEAAKHGEVILRWRIYK